MHIPIELLIEAERKQRELEAEAARPRLQLEIPPPEYAPEIDHEYDDRGFVVEDAPPDEKSDRGVIIIEM
jgi:hypothetical protein